MWRADKKHGAGQLVFAKPLNPNVLSADRYAGEFQDDRPHGRGEMCYDAAGCALRGEFDRGAPNGIMLATYQNGDVYAGEWQAHKAHGYGATLYKNDDVYFGTCQAGKVRAPPWLACAVC